MDQHKIEALRREYAREELSESQVQADAIDQFALWFKQAMASELTEVNAMSLATANAEGRPSVRIVLLKGFGPKGFRFFTNYQSRKGRELDENPHAALCFFWEQLERQVRIEGDVQRLGKEESLKYFHQRPRLSQLGALASEQSRIIENREVLEDAMQELEHKFEDQPVPMPENWGGYILKPVRIEFWQGRRGRLHDRILYSREGKDWKISRLSP